MKYILCEIDSIKYAVSVEDVDRIDETGRIDESTLTPSYNYLLQKATSGNRVMGTQTLVLSASSGEEPTSVSIDTLIGIHEDTGAVTYPYPQESTDSPSGLFETIMILDDVPYVVLSAEELSKGTV